MKALRPDHRRRSGRSRPSRRRGGGGADPARRASPVRGQEAGNHALAQREINRLLVELAREGHGVVRLRGGDPFIFGRGGEEMAPCSRLASSARSVPGITAAAGAASATGTPLTTATRADPWWFATGHPSDHTVDLDLAALARRQTVVIPWASARSRSSCTR